MEAYWLRERCCQLESAYSAVVPDRNSVQLTERVLAVCPNQPAAIARKPRTVSADGATALNDSPAAASRCSTASWKTCATSSAWTWCISSVPRPRPDRDFL